MADGNPIRYQDLIAPDDSIEKLIGQLQNLEETYSGMVKTVQSQAQQVANSLKTVSGATEQGRTKIKEQSEEAKRLEKAYKQLDAALAANAKEIARLNAVKREANYYNKMIGFENMNGILNRISSWLEKMFSSYSVYDCGRGHFAALCDGISEEAVDKIRSESMARFEKPWGKGKFSLIFPVQFGVIHLPDDAKTVENLFMIIDAPFDGKLSTELDAGKVIADYERNVLVERLIDKALKNKSFEVYYQPIWNYTTGKVQSAEALCRLIDDEYGMIPPDEFIPVSERNGSILEIGKLVFDEVCRSYKEDRFKSLGIEYVEVNLSVVQCMSRDLKEEFDATLEKYSLDAECINLEITESATTQNRKILLDTIETLKSRGFTFSLDDYGTGYSNITYMYEMPFSIIKIDKSILWKAMDPVTGEGQRNAVIYLENTVRMLKDMDYHILVEGVETLEQKMFLEKLEVDYLQGYYFSKPVRKQVFTDYLKVVNA